MALKTSFPPAFQHLVFRDGDLGVTWRRIRTRHGVVGLASKTKDFLGTGSSGPAHPTFAEGGASEVTGVVAIRNGVAWNQTALHFYN